MEQYYLITKELMDKLTGNLGSIACSTHFYDELKSISDDLTSCPIIDLSDEAITKESEISSVQSNSFYMDRGGINLKWYKLGYEIALTCLKQTLNETK